MSEFLEATLLTGERLRGTEDAFKATLRAWPDLVEARWAMQEMGAGHAVTVRAINPAAVALVTEVPS